MDVYGSRLDALIPWVSQRQLGYWVSRGYVVPRNAGPAGRGPGNGRVFSPAEALVLLTMARLVRAGLAAGKAADAARVAVLVAGPDGSASVEIDPGITVTIGGLR